ncbi:hypothetical protein LSH36_684g01027 [Paralvinella palmiformis]|uniref:protein-tyrosine-phosphatase n=1 Tax=Paralvinella palmiformis TaxID=53620 RepID=A0AAD9J2E0_9ANNE|nr:hypothetical protein LSH36_684g01027 [Paralvinella palmiformis]
MMEYYRRVLLASENEEEEVPEVIEYPDEVYIDKMQRILGSFPNIGVPPEPTKIRPNVYLGTSANAENLHLLKRTGIQYLLNCAGSGNVYQFRRYKEMYTVESGINGYQELLIDDSESTNIRTFFERAHAFIDYARGRGANVLVYCHGASRSGAIILSYMIRQRMPLLAATRELKDKRRVVLTNDAFIKQLVGYARENDMLDVNISTVYAPRFGRKLDKHRLQRAHLPIFF